MLKKDLPSDRHSRVSLSVKQTTSIKSKFEFTGGVFNDKKLRLAYKSFDWPIKATIGLKASIGSILQFNYQTSEVKPSMTTTGAASFVLSKNSAEYASSGSDK